LFEPASYFERLINAAIYETKHLGILYKIYVHLLHISMAFKYMTKRNGILTGKEMMAPINCQSQALSETNVKIF
jgi:hypothetical protein